MYATEQIKEYLKPEGWMVLNNFKKEIKMIGDIVEQDEIIENAAILVRGLGGLKQYLGVLTSSRLLTTDKQKKIVTYSYSDMLKPIVTNKINSTEIKFQYGSEEIQINILTSDNSKLFLQNLQEKLNILPAPQLETEERKVVRVMKPIKMSIEILNGKEQLIDQGSVFKLTQTKPGTIEISVNYKAPETFKLIKWERVENIQKSALNIAGWSLIGSTLGNAGAIAGAMGANIGKDKSVATLFLKRENGDKVPLVIKCDKKDLEKLSLIIVAEDDEVVEVVQPVAHNQISAADEILKFKQLLDNGILTQEEFDAKKKQLLGI